MGRRRNHYHVYVIELSKDVLDEPRFRKANPGYRAGKPCVYVGMTGLDPDVRFDKHKACACCPSSTRSMTPVRMMTPARWRSNWRSTSARRGTACGRR